MANAVATERWIRPQTGARRHSATAKPPKRSAEASRGTWRAAVTGSPIGLCPPSPERRAASSPLDEVPMRAPMRERLEPEIFRLPVERLREGYYSDAYFNFTKQLLEEHDQHPRVLMQVFQKERSVLGGIDEAIAVLGGDTVAAAREFADRFADEMNVTVLVDFDNDSIRTSLEVADALGDKLWGVRLDTSENLVDRALWDLMGTFRPTGVNPVLVGRVRAALDEAGHGHVRIVVSGGFDAAKIRR